VGTGLLSQWQNGTLQVIAPKSAATSNTVVNPKPGWSN
jgi:branched-chain amino acid transport system substrate-binding protein